MLLTTTLLWFSGGTSLATTCPLAGVIEQHNGELLTYQPGESYCANVIVGGDAIWTTGFEFLMPYSENTFSITIYAPSDLIGYVGYAVTSGPSGTGHSFRGNGLLAGESVTFEMGGGSFSSQNWLSITAPDMPALSTIETTSAVPIPAAVWLFGSGLIGLVGFARRKVT